MFFVWNSIVWCHVALPNAQIEISENQIAINNEVLKNLVISHELFQLSEVAEVLLYRVKLKALTHISQWYDRQAMCMCESSLDISYCRAA